MRHAGFTGLGCIGLPDISSCYEQIFSFLFQMYAMRAYTHKVGLNHEIRWEKIFKVGVYLLNYKLMLV